ncbi:MAG: site-2 protease family protein [Acidobacteria bacterium]|nr:MAG: site-2 protease family protein [Acidobacteriota bacterium]REK02679.1 MAG: site-2 protease family protein [Acidobacteriota bacterium]REK13516.1 MAG: site-2 protease family protein [Acidobacteriota bacterium]REK41510.1 MAG: site-2 protease family protein [Acidobacteriota bacterium]
MGEVAIAEFLSHLVIFMVVLLLAVSCHEAAHAWVSHKFGDDTAYMLGRVTLNPVKHTDVIGTLVIPIAGFVFGAIGGMLGSIPLIGWGKPTPVNPRNWSNYRTANFWVSVAGIIANLILVTIGIVLAKVLMTQGVAPIEFFEKSSNPLIIFVGDLMILNLSLAIFNLLPIPPLDGGKVLSSILPDSFSPALELIEQYGFMLLLLFIFMGLFNLIITPFIIALFEILQRI